MNVIEVAVRNKVATKADATEYICGNSDFVIVFDFDDEWNAFDAKTARFVYEGKHQDIVFTGDRCPVPVISNTHRIYVGVFAGDLHTTTPAYIPAKKSILCDSGSPEAPPEDVYAQIMALIQGLGDPDPEDIAAAVAEYMAKNPIQETDPTVPEWAKGEKKPSYTAEEVGAIPLDKLAEATETALRTAKESGEFDGPPGKDGVSPTVSIAAITGGNRVTIVDAKGSKDFDVKDGKAGQPGYTPQKGTDYWTTADRQQMVSDVLAALPVYNGEVSEA